MESPSPLFVYGGFYFLFDNYLWKLGIFHNLGIVWYPNLEGRWAGTQLSSFKDKGGKNVQVKSVLEIRQTFSHISINAYYEKSDSFSVVGSFTKLNGEVYLYYSYDNDPNALKEGTMQMHKGTVKLKKLLKENKLKGFYWNSIGNTGDINLIYDQKNLLGRL